MKVLGRPDSGSSAGSASQVSQPLSCCSAARQTSSKGEGGAKRSLPQARASWPDSHEWLGCGIAITASPSSRNSMVPPPLEEPLLRPVDGELLEALPGERRLLRRDDARVDALPGDLAREAAVLDLRAAVHDDLDALRLGPRGGLVVADRELHPDHLGRRLEGERLVGDRAGGLRVAEDLDHVDGARQ